MLTATTNTPRASRILTAEEIQEKLKADMEKRPWVDPRLVEAQKEAQLRAEREAIEEARRVALQAAELPAGSLSPKQLRARMEVLFAKHGVQPAEELIKLALAKNDNGEDLCDIEQKIKIWSKLLEYSVPKPKSVEISGEVDHKLTVVVKKFDPERGIGVNGLSTMRQDIVDVEAVQTPGLVEGQRGS